MNTGTRWISAIAALALAAPAAAQADGPYKLVITWYQTITVIDYPSAARCERARKVVNERAKQKLAGTGLPEESADIAVCIPG